MKTGDKIAIVNCSNGQSASSKAKLQKLHTELTRMGLIPVWSPYIYEKEYLFSGFAQERAKSLMDFYQDDEIKEIFDISGGDIANEILPYLDYDVIAGSDKRFWGYSDLTTVLNAVYAKTGRQTVLYQIRNLINSDSENQLARFRKSMLEDASDLFDFSFDFIQKEEMSGIVAGGNIRCLLKLAGTEYWPDMTGKILLLEAYGGEVPQMVTYLNQLSQIGVFRQINGILLGTFTKMEEKMCRPQIGELVKRYAGEEIPIACTAQVGHGADARAVIIGKELTLRKNFRCSLRGL